MPDNQHIVLASRPAGRITPDQFRLEHCPQPNRAASDALLAVEWLAMDPYLRSVIAGRHLGAALQAGECMPGQGIARVVDAASDGPIQPGDRVVLDCGWTRWLSKPADSLRPLKLPADIPPQAALGILGMPGLTAWAGLHRIAAAQPGEVVAVSSASGTVGSAVIQLARLAGCTTIGITSTRKVDDVRNDLKADFVLDREQPLAEQLKDLNVPRLDVYFENAGGAILEAMLGHLARHARVVLCGMMAQYELDQRPAGPNLGPVIAARASLHGLVVYDHFHAMPQFLASAIPLYRLGLLQCRETVFPGLAKAPEAFCALMSGTTRGRVLVQMEALETDLEVPQQRFGISMRRQVR